VVVCATVRIYTTWTNNLFSLLCILGIYLLFLDFFPPYILPVLIRCCVMAQYRQEANQLMEGIPFVVLIAFIFLSIFFFKLFIRSIFRSIVEALSSSHSTYEYVVSSPFGSAFYTSGYWSFDFKLFGFISIDRKASNFPMGNSTRIGRWLPSSIDICRVSCYLFSSP